MISEYIRRTVWKMTVPAMVGILLLTGCGKSAGSEVEASDSGRPKISIGLRTSGIKYVESSPDINKDEHVLAFEDKLGVDLDITLIPHDNFSEN